MTESAPVFRQYAIPGPIMAAGAQFASGLLVQLREPRLLEVEDRLHTFQHPHGVQAGSSCARAVQLGPRDHNA